MSRRRRRRTVRIAIPVGVVAVAGIVAGFLLTRGDGEPVVHKISIDGRPSAVAVAAGLVWVTDDENHVVHVIDPDENEVVGEPIDVDRNPIAIAGDERAVWVAHATGSVARIDTDTRKASDPVDVGGSLTGIAISTRRVWVADLEEGQVIEIDPRGARVLDRIQLPLGAVRVATAGRDVWVTNQENTVEKISTRRGRLPTVTVGPGPIGLVHHRGEIWVAVSDDDSVAVVDADKAERTRTFLDVGRAPVAVASTSAFVWVANQEDATLVRLDRDEGVVDADEPRPSPSELRPALEIGTHPRGLAADGEDVWAVGTNPSLVVRVEP